METYAYIPLSRLQSFLVKVVCSRPMAHGRWEIGTLDPDEVIRCHSNLCVPGFVDPPRFLLFKPGRGIETRSRQAAPTFITGRAWSHRAWSYMV